MTTDYLHRDMAHEAIQIGEEIAPQIDLLMQQAFGKHLCQTHAVAFQQWQSHREGQR